MAGPAVANIGVGAPLATGGITVLPAGATLPTNVTPALVAGGTRLGYVADDGLRPSGERTSTDIFDWGGDLIYSPQDQHAVQFQFKLLSAFDPDTLKEVFGEDNVTTVGALTTVEETGSPLTIHPWVFDMRDSSKRVRIVVPAGQITAAAEEPFVRNGLQGFDVTLTCYKDENGRKAHRFYDNGSTPSAPSIVSHSPASVGAAGGDLVQLNGMNFSGTTDVTVGATPVTEFLVVDDQTLIITVPAKTAGAHDVIVTNAVGASAAYSITYV